MTNTASVTGRDGFIITKALAYAITMIDSLPAEKQEWSDRQDMVAIMKSNLFAPSAVICSAIHTGFITDFVDMKRPSDKPDGLRSFVDNAIVMMRENGADLGELRILKPVPADDEVDFIEDGAAPTPEPEFVDDDEEVTA